MSERPLAIDLYAGLGGWAEGLLAEGFDVIGFDIEQHVYGEHRYPGKLVIQDVLSLHGSQFKDASLIVASPPCQAYSYRAMPWSRAKALPPPDNTLFEACFRIQREACEAAGRHIPLIVENVRGAQKWVGRARWNFGSFYLWGDVPALMPITLNRAVMKNGIAHRSNGETNFHGHKSQGMNWSDRKKRGQDFTRIAGLQTAGLKNGGDWFGSGDNCSLQRHFSGVKGVPHRTSGHWTNPSEHKGIKHQESGHAWWRTGHGRLPSASLRRKEVSALIAKIPLPLARHIGAVFRP